MVVQAGRFTDEDEKTFAFFMKLFKDNLKDYLIVVFTHKYRLESLKMSLDEFVKTIEKDSNLHRLIEASRRNYMALGYNGEVKDSASDVEKLLSIIEKIRKQNEGKCYSTDLFEKALEENKPGLFRRFLNWLFPKTRS